jgi:hypothetical protein
MANVERREAASDLVTVRRSTLGSRRRGGAAVADGHLGSGRGLAGGYQLLVSLATGHNWGIWNLGMNPPVREGVCLCAMVGFQGPLMVSHLLG